MLTVDGSGDGGDHDSRDVLLCVRSDLNIA